MKTLGILTHSYLREAALLRVKRYAKVALIAPPDSPLHRIADYSIPIDSLDADIDHIRTAVNVAVERGVPLDGLTSWRDPNVLPIATIAGERGLITAPPESLEILSSKSSFRKWLGDNISSEIQVVVPFAIVEKGISLDKFTKLVRSLLSFSPLILKPDRGSCSYGVYRVDAGTDLSTLWQTISSWQHYRGGDFLLEAEVSGEEASVETLATEQESIAVLTRYLPGYEDYFYEVGHYVSAAVPAWAEDSIRLAREIHSRLPLRSILTHLEIIVTANGKPAVVELNPRPAGDLIPELHRLVNGLDLYGALATISTEPSVDLSRFVEPSRYRNSVIRFHRPVAGKIGIRANPGSYLRASDDQFSLLDPVGSILTGGITNDDRPAYALFSGDDLPELMSRTHSTLSTCINVERAPMVISQR